MQAIMEKQETKTFFPFQQEIYNQTLDIIEDNSKTKSIITLPCGSGKTFIVQALLEKLSKQGIKAAFFLGKNVLISQSEKDFYSVLKAGRSRDFDNDNNIQIISLDTAYARRQYFHTLGIQIAFFDELHEYAHGEKLKFFQENIPYTFGITATPIKANGYLLPDYDNYLGKDIQYTDMVKIGRVVPSILRGDNIYNIKMKEKVEKLELTNKMGYQDYKDKDIDDLIIDINNSQEIIDAYRQVEIEAKLKHGYAQGIALTGTIKQSEFICGAFKQAGYRAAVLHSKQKKDEQQKILSDYKNGQYDILFSVNMLVAGFDCQSVNIVMPLAPTKSKTKAGQFEPRGGRVYTGDNPLYKNKDCFWFLDLAAWSFEHGSCMDYKFYEFEPPKKQKEPMTHKECPQCGIYVEINKDECSSCGFLFKNAIGEIREVSEKEYGLKINNIVEIKTAQAKLLENIDFALETGRYNDNDYWFGKCRTQQEFFKKLLDTKRYNEKIQTFYKRKNKLLTGILCNKIEAWKLRY